MKPIIAIDNSTKLEYDFVQEDALQKPEQIELRKDTLYLAMVLGNNYGKKAQMQVVTTEGIIELHGIVLVMNESTVFLKGGIQIPIHAIAEVKIY